MGAQLSSYFDPRTYGYGFFPYNVAAISDSNVEVDTPACPEEGMPMCETDAAGTINQSNTEGAVMMNCKRDSSGGIIPLLATNGKRNDQVSSKYFPSDENSACPGNSDGGDDFDDENTLFHSCNEDFFETRTSSNKSDLIPGQPVNAVTKRHSVGSGSACFPNGSRFPRRSTSMLNGRSDDPDAVKRRSMGPLKMAHLNGLTISRAQIMFAQNDESRAPKDDRRKNLEAKLDEGQVFVEFEKIPKKVTTTECRVALNPENLSKNRFKDVHPYDSSRVRLKPKSSNSSGYINASHIRVRVKGQELWYIAAQAPLQNTTEDFWQMIWEQDIQVIAMLTQLKELGKEKCYPYWPTTPGSKHKLTFGEFQVTLKFSNDSLCYVSNGLSLKHKGSSKERMIWHLQYTDWPDHGCPDDVHGFLAFLEEIESVNRHIAIENPESEKKYPTLVHCSAGVGRAGVAILVEVMKTCLEFNQNVDIPTVLATLRGQRMHMVQTVSQYTFVYKTLIQYLKNSRLI